MRGSGHGELCRSQQALWFLLKVKWAQQWVNGKFCVMFLWSQFFKKWEKMERKAVGRDTAEEWDGPMCYKYHWEWTAEGWRSLRKGVAIIRVRGEVAQTEVLAVRVESSSQILDAHWVDYIGFADGLVTGMKDRIQDDSKISALSSWHDGVAFTEMGSLWMKQAFWGKTRYSVSGMWSMRGL